MCTAALEIKLALWRVYAGSREPKLSAKSKERVLHTHHITATQHACTHSARCEPNTCPRVQSFRTPTSTPFIPLRSAAAAAEERAVFAAVSSFMQAASANQIGNVNKGGNCAQCSGVSDSETIHSSGGAESECQR